MPLSAWLVTTAISALVLALAGGIDDAPRKPFDWARGMICGALTFGACYLSGISG